MAGLSDVLQFFLQPRRRTPSANWPAGATTEPQPIPTPIYPDYQDVSISPAWYPRPTPPRRPQRAAAGPARPAPAQPGGGGFRDFAQVLLNPYEAPPKRAAETPPEPTPTVTPPSGADIEPAPPAPPPPTVTTAAPAAPTMPGRSPDEEMEALIKRMIRSPEQISTDVTRHLGKPPAQAGRFGISPLEMVIMLLPTLFGGSQGTTAMFRGALAGHAARQAQGRDFREAYAKRAADLGARMEESDWKRVGALAPYYTTKAAERERFSIQRADQDLRRQKTAFDQQMRTARQAFEVFKWANPSASAQLRAQTATLDRAVREAHYKATQALTEGRLDEYRRHNLEAESLRSQALDLEAQQVEIARGRLNLAIGREGRLATGAGGLKSGDATRIMTYHRFVTDKADEMEEDLAQAIIMDPAVRKKLETRMNFYRAESSRLDPIISGLTGGAAPPVETPPPAPSAPTPGPAAPAASKKTLSRTQIRDIVDSRRRQGKPATEADVERAARQQGFSIVP